MMTTWVVWRGLGLERTSRDLQSPLGLPGVLLHKWEIILSLI